MALFEKKKKFKIASRVTKERVFLMDQRIHPQMMMADSDVVESEKLQKRNERNEKRMSRRDLQEIPHMKVPLLAGMAEIDYDVFPSSSLPPSVSSEIEFEASIHIKSATRHKSSDIS